MPQIGVLEAHQLHTDKPVRCVKKSVADLLCRRLIAKRISKRLIQMLIVKSVLEFPREFVQPAAKPYIPDRMPPREVPGVFFREPQSAAWREQHRMVRLEAQS